jgi:hypothetical protein
MLEPTRYRSIYTGAEIDQKLNSVDDKIDSSIISVDVTEDSVDKIPASSVTANLNQRITQLNDPNYFLQLFLELPNSNIFTDAYKDKIDGINAQFKGVYATIADRTNNLDTTNFLGLELTLIIDDGSGFSRFDYWNNQTNGWSIANFFKDGSQDPLSVPVPATVRFAAITLANATACKFFVNIKVGSQIKSMEILANSDGTNSYLIVTNVVGTNPTIYDDLADITTSIESGQLVIYVTTKLSSSVVSGKLIAEL